QVTEMDGAGLQLLAVIRREAGISGTGLSVTGQSQVVMQALQLCRTEASESALPTIFDRQGKSR
ncbi:hypothetical protein O6474_24865, partial [Salmonella enterica subsp. enterica]